MPTQAASEVASVAPMVRKVMGVLSLMLAARAARDVKDPVGLARPAMAIFSSMGLGATFWVTFVSGIIMFRNMSRPAFADLQSKLFPAYFAVQVLCGAFTAGSHGLHFGKASRAGMAALAPVCLMPFLNMVYVGPRTTQLMLQRAAATEGSAEWLALNGQFFKWHGISSICNLVAFLGQLGYAVFLGGQIPRGVSQNQVAQEMAPTGQLRVAINMRNQLLVTGKSATGEPTGLAPSMAAAFALKLGVPLVYVPYDSPGKLADDAGADKWDVAMIGVDPARAKYVNFTAPYCEIECTYAVDARSEFKACDDVDRPGVRVLGCGGSAYMLWLERNLRHATLEKVEGHEATYEKFQAGGFEAMAGLTSKLTKDASKRPGTILLPGKFMAVEQAACTKKGRDAGFALLSQFIEDAKASGYVRRLMEEYNVASDLVVSKAAAGN